jgi:hypothetical protein
MTGDAERLRAELEALYPYVEERDRLVEERDRLEEQLRGADERIAELTYQRDRLRWRIEALKSRRFMRLARALLDAVRDPRRLVRLPLELVRIVTTPSRRPPEPVMPEVVARRSVANRATTETRTERELRLRFLAPAVPNALDDLHVAAILDTFSASCFAPECRLTRFRPDNWRETLEARPPHLLLVESAWQGNDGAWQYQVGSYSYPDSVGLPHLTAVVEWCRARDIPTVFWNKEDPVHFDKFKEAAQLFDVVLTTDADRIDAYRALPGLRAEVIDALPFAAQPAIHNPVLAPPEREAVPVFAGTYYKNRHPERREQLEMLLDAALPLGLRIFDRMDGKESDSVGYPARFVDHISGGLPYDEMVEAYKRFRVFLNTNSVTESPTMFSRRVFELLASGTPVVSTPSLGMEEMLGDVIDVVSDPADAHDAIQALLTDDEHWHRRSRAGIRKVMDEHTYRHRLATVARLAGSTFDVVEPDITVALLDEDDPALFRVVHELAEHGTASQILFGVTDEASPTPHPSVVRVTQSGASDQGSRFRDLAARAGSEWLLVVAAVSDLRWEEVADLRAALSYTEAAAIGRSDAGPPHRYVTTLSPAPVLVRRDVVERHGWHLDHDTAKRLQADLLARGHRLYATDLTGDHR